MATPQCSNCLFSFIAPASANTTANTTGASFTGQRFCNRQAPNPPNNAVSQGWLWPLVADDWWCGDGADATSGVSYSAALRGVAGYPFANGVVALAAASSTPVAVNNTGTTVLLTPANAAAGTLVAVHGVYTQLTDTGFTILTADGSSAAGTESFGWILF